MSDIFLDVSFCISSEFNQYFQNSFGLQGELLPWVKDKNLCLYYLLASVVYKP